MLAPRSFLFSRPHTSNSSPPSRSPSSTTLSRPKRQVTSAPSYEGSPSPKVRQAAPSQPSKRSMSTTVTAVITKPDHASEPVTIPTKTHSRQSSRDSRSSEQRQAQRNVRNTPETTASRRARDVHSPDAIPPSVAAMLAMTSIPQRRTSTRRKDPATYQRLTVDAILKHTKGSEKELSMSSETSPLHLLLSPPGDSFDDELMGSETGLESYLSTRSLSTESVPSLAGASIGDSSSLSLPSLMTPSPSRKRSVSRRPLQPVSSPPREITSDHPLSDPLDFEGLDFRVFADKEKTPSIHSCDPDESLLIQTPQPRRKSAFKSNLTASLKALRAAARSISSITTPMITPDDFLTRSIITIDPRVPFTDERMPPRLEDTPTPALRRYLNPTTNAPIEAYVSSSLAQAKSTECTASIQMQTYRVSKASKATPTNVISRRTSNTPEAVFAEVAAGPVARQRDMRENSDFIRIAVMEMLMRRNGKLDERVPGRAKWALPPRKPSAKVYEIGEGGVPARWIAISAR